MTSEFSIQAQLVDVVSGEIAAKKVFVRNGTIADIASVSENVATNFLIPGFVDAHIHIESSMLLPSQFARTAVMHGTVDGSDPHEIANVCGFAGVELMLRDAAQTSFKFHFGAPCCVPATGFETAGACLDADDIEKMLEDPRIGYLSEVMDYPGVLAGNAQLISKIGAAKQRNKPIDGHAPGLMGADARQYFASGITTDHECFTIAEAREKLPWAARSPFAKVQRPGISTRLSR